MNRSPFDTEAWEGEEPSEYEQDLQAALDAGEPWFSFETWERVCARKLPHPFGPPTEDDDPDLDIPF